MTRLDGGDVVGDDGCVSRRHDYAAAELTPVTLREAVLRRPAMYFGDLDRADWPPIFAVWTATVLLDYAVGPVKHAALTLHGGGVLSAVVANARVAWPARATLRPIDELVGRRMWWHQLALSSTVTVQLDGDEPGEPQRVGDELIWSHLDIATWMMLDPDLIGTGADHWWHNGPDRLRALLAADRSRLTPGSIIKIIDEATGAVAEVG